MDNYGMSPDTGNMGGNFYNANNRIEQPNGMATVSQVCGIIAVISVFTLMIYPALILGSLAIILGLLSRGSRKRLPAKAKTGVVTGAVAVGVNLALIALTLFIIFSDGPMKRQLNATCKQVYGQTFDDMLQDAMDGELNLDYYNLQ